jgi:hypothetical protein
MLLTAALTLLYDNALLWGRAMNLVSGVLVACLIARLVRVESRNLWAGLLAAGFFLGSTFVYHWLPLYRVDLVGLAFAFAGVYFVWRWERTSKRETRNEKRPGFDVNLGLALLLFLLALYTKHSLLFAPAAAIAAIFLRDRRTAVLFAIVLGATGGALFLILEWVTRGGWSFGLVLLNATVWSPAILVELIGRFVVTYAVLLGLALWSWVERVRENKLGVLELYGAAALATLVLAGREGAWENYFFEAIAMTCLFAGLAIARVLSQPTDNAPGARARVWQWAVPLLLLVQLWLFWSEHDPRIAQRLFETVSAGNQSLAPTVRAAEGTLIAEDMGLLWVNDKPISYYSFPYSTLARSGRYDQKWELENLTAGNFPLVILNRGTRENVDQFGNFTREFVSALDYGYARTRDNLTYDVYEPAPLQHRESRGTFGDTFELAGWSVGPDALRAGEKLTVTVLWRAVKQPAARYTMFAHLEDEDGKIAQDDHEPYDGSYPTTNWAEGEMVRDTFQLQVPVNLEPGTYTLRIGWYDTNTQDGLSLQDGSDRLELTQFQVQ